MMKKIFLLLLICASAMSAFSQVTFSPSTFTAEDEVTITLDISGTPLAGQDNIYVWAFSNDGVGGGKDALSNGMWTNSSDQAKMTKIATDKFTFKFTGTTLFGQSPAELINFGFLAKTKDGSKQSADFKPYKFDPLVFVPNQFRLFPAKVEAADMATVYFHQNLATDQNLQRMVDVKVNLTFYDDAATPAIVGTKTELATTQPSANVYAFSFIPERLITIPAGVKLGKFSYQFVGSVRDATGATVPYVGPVNEVVYFNFN